jgi:hypothetical protein
MIAHAAHKLSGLQKQVLALYRALLREAIKKDKILSASTPVVQLFASEPPKLDSSDSLHSTTSSFVRSEFRYQAATVKRSDFEKIENKVRQGYKHLKLLRMPGTQVVGRVS